MDITVFEDLGNTMRFDSASDRLDKEIFPEQSYNWRQYDSQHIHLDGYFSTLQLRAISDIMDEFNK